MLAYNTFDNMQDASLSVTYGFADIQGNTFEKLTGKPFVDLRPLSEIVSNMKIRIFGPSSRSRNLVQAPHTLQFVDSEIFIGKFKC